MCHGRGSPPRPIRRRCPGTPAHWTGSCLVIRQSTARLRGGSIGGKLPGDDRPRACSAEIPTRQPRAGRHAEKERGRWRRDFPPAAASVHPSTCHGLSEVARRLSPVSCTGSETRMLHSPIERRWSRRRRPPGGCNRARQQGPCRPLPATRRLPRFARSAGLPCREALPDWRARRGRPRGARSTRSGALQGVRLNACDQRRRPERDERLGRDLQRERGHGRVGSQQAMTSPGKPFEQPLAKGREGRGIRRVHPEHHDDATPGRGRRGRRLRPDPGTRATREQQQGRKSEHPRPAVAHRNRA